MPITSFRLNSLQAPVLGLSIRQKMTTWHYAPHMHAAIYIRIVEECPPQTLNSTCRKYALVWGTIGLW